MTSQTHHIAIGPVADNALSTDLETNFKKKGRKSSEDKLREMAAASGFGGALPWERRKTASRERQALRDGLTFPGLWVAEVVGKQKDFEIELQLGTPGVPGEQAQAAGQIMIGSAPPQTDLALTENTLTAEELEKAQAVQASTEELNHQVDPSLLEPDAPEAKPARAQKVVPGLNVGRSSTAGWATLPSNALSLVSKPSRKTVKARNLATCLTISDSFALYVRINSQTVRTKYLKSEGGIDSPSLESRTGQWTPFKFEVVTRAVPSPAALLSTARRYAPHDELTPDILTYGSTVRLVDLQTGVKSEPVKLVKVEKNEILVGEKEGHPVSELQRIAFARLQDGVEDVRGGARWFLSAPGARAGGGELLPEQPVRQRRKKSPKNKVADADEAQDDQALVEQTLEDLANEQSRADEMEKLGGADQSEVKLSEEDAELPPEFKEALIEMEAEARAAANGHESTQGGLDAYEPGAEDAAQVEEEEEGEEDGEIKKKRPKTKRNALARATLAEQEGSGTQNALQWVKAVREDKEVVIEVGKEKRKERRTVEMIEDWMSWVITGVGELSRPDPKNPAVGLTPSIQILSVTPSSTL